MIDLPLHPIAVHFPIVLGVLLPLFGILIFWGIRKECLNPQTWSLLVIMSALYLGSAIFAKEMGERDEDLAEKVVSERVLHEHEEAGEKVPLVAGVLFLAFLAPLVLKKKQNALKSLAIALSVVSLFPLLNAGHTGGELVYKEGAAQAHINPLYKSQAHEDHDEDEDND